MFINILSVGVEEEQPTSFQLSMRTEQREMDINLNIGGSTPVYEGTSSQQGLWSTGTDCPGGLRILLLWRYSRPVWIPTCAACCRTPALQGGWTQCSLEDPSSPYSSVIPWQLQWCRLTCLQIRCLVSVDVSGVSYLDSSCHRIKAVLSFKVCLISPWLV